MIEIKNLTKRFGSAIILDDVTLSLPNRGLVVIRGENGCGKSTLFNILSFMDSDFSGNYVYCGTDSRKMTLSQKDVIRRNEISYVFQKNNLVTYLDAKENVTLRRKATGISSSDWHHMSQGQQEMIALERELIPGRKMYLLDEVTANLDVNNQKSVIEKLKMLSAESLVIIVCHDFDLSEMADCVYVMKDRKILLTKGNAEVTKQIASQISKKEKVSFPWHVFARRTRSNAVFYLLSVFVLSITMMLFWMGMSASHEDGLGYLKEATKENQTLVIQTTEEHSAEEVMRKFPDQSYIQMSSHVVYTDKVDDDGKIHASSKTIQFCQMDTDGDGFYEGLSEKIELAEDESVPEGFAYYYDAENGLPRKILSKDGTYMFSGNLQNTWACEGVSGYTAFRNRNGFGYQYMNLNSYEYVFGSLPDITLEDDTFYVNCPSLAVEGRTKFEYAPAAYGDGDMFGNFNNVFPNGVYVKYYSFPKGNSSNLTYILVSDSTMDKILTEYKGFHRNVVVTLEQNKGRILRYINSNCLGVSYFNTGSTAGLKDYLSTVSTRKDTTTSITYGLMEYTSNFLVIVFIAIVNVGILDRQRRNDRILKSDGFSVIHRYLMDYLPVLASLILSAVIGLLLVLLAYGMNGNSVFSPNPLYVIFSLFIQIVIYTAAHLVCYFLKRRHL